MPNDNNQQRTEKAIADALAGVLGSLVSLFAFYPLDVIKTNRQATLKSSSSSSSSSTSGTSHGCRREGSFVSPFCSSMTSFSTFRKTYLRGLSSKTLHTIASSFLFFYFDSFLVSAWMTKKKKRNGRNNTFTATPPQMTTLSRLILSAIAAMMNTCLTLPLDVLSAQQQTKGTHINKDDAEEVQNNDNHHELDNHCKKQEEEEEVFFVATSMDSSSSSSSNESEGHHNEFAMDEKKDNEDDSGEDEAENRTDTKVSLSTSSSSLCASLPRTLSRIIDTPLFSSTASTEKKNMLSLWKGLWPSLLLCSNPSIHYTVFDMLKARILQQKEQSRTNSNTTTATISLSSREAFLAGLIAKAVATIVTYPLIRAKVIMIVSASSSVQTQTKKSRDDSHNNHHQHNNCDRGMIQTLQEIYHQHGLSGLYRGCDLQLFHTVLKSALMMMVRERINVTTRRMVLARHSKTSK